MDPKSLASAAVVLAGLLLPDRLRTASATGALPTAIISGTARKPASGLNGFSGHGTTGADHENFNIAARIKAFLKNNPDLDPLEAQEFQALLSLVQNDDNWDLLSQALDGFNNQIQLGLPGVFLSPGSTALSTTPPLPSLIGGAVGYPPSLGNIPTSAPYPPSGFQPWRAGQFEFLQLVLIDEWGQALWPVSSSNYQHEKVYMPVDLSPVLTSLGATFQVVTGPAIAAISPTVALAANGPLAF